MIDFQNCEYFTHYLTDEQGRLIEVPFRRGEKDGAFVDWITFTFRKETIEMMKGVCITPTEYVAAASEIMMEIFGFGVSEKIGRGKYFYDACYRLGTEAAPYGTLHFGGQRDTVLVDVGGKGCMAAKAAWELRAYEFLKQAVRPVISRIDHARDFFHGEYNPEQAEADHDNGLFVVKNMNPKSQRIGTDWRSHDNSGKTFQVGGKASAKVARIYEKGKQLGDKTSGICRFEVQHRRDKNRVLPLDMLLYPGEYLAGAYPLLNETLFRLPVKRAETNNLVAGTTFQQKLLHGKNQVGRLVRFLSDVGWTPEQIVSELIGEADKYPKGLNPEEYDCALVAPVYLHQDDEQTILQELDDVVTQMPEPPSLLTDDLKNWLRLKLYGKHEYFSPERQIEQDIVEKQRIEEYQDRYLAFIWEKYGTFFYKKEHFKNQL